MKDAHWYYSKMNSVESAIVRTQDVNEKAKLEKYLDQLHDEFYLLEEDN